MLANDDPLARVLDLDAPHFRRGLTIGILGALLIHVAGATEAARLANGLGGWARDTRSNIHQYFERLYEVEMVNAPPPPPPPEEKIEPEAPKPLPASKAPREQEPAPAPAQAGKILTQEPDPDAPVDLTGQGFVTGNAETYAGGVTASNGTSKSAVHNLNATSGGVPGGTGTKPGPAAPSAPQLSREASLSGGREWDCPWPPEANEDQIDFQRVSMMVTVRADGTVQDARIANDPGHGFGRMARQCALRQRFDPALDRAGTPVLSTLRLGVTFQR